MSRWPTFASARCIANANAELTQAERASVAVNQSRKIQGEKSRIGHFGLFLFPIWWDTCLAQTSSPATQSPPYATAGSAPSRIAAADTSSSLPAYSDIISCRRCRSTPRSAPAPAPRAWFCCSFGPLTVFFNLPGCRFSPCLLFSCATLCSLLTMRLLFFDIN